ncbi:YhfC family intramembrane metalloprotease [Metabacillus litoralis]|uniref:YhfC family intramembrane metalloprotease n=1 Tax=Metabacillus litoralis TaxID=152268 RepID=UPI001CFCDEEA|nr:YhfC family intramembrane metalloprotease [Metabacillus litoralis]
MISNVTIASMFIPVIFSFLLFFGLIMYYKKKVGISIKPIIIGAVGFIVITQVLEKILHVVVISAFPNYAEHPWAFGLYGASAAGIFEEIGRFILFTWLLKKYHTYKDGVSFGIGWGGIEAIVLMLLINVPNIIFSFMINSGIFESSMLGQLTSEQLTILKETVLNQSVSNSLFMTMERFFAVFLQIALSLLVLYAVVEKKFSYVILAIIVHGVIDFPLVFFQTGYLEQIWIIELYIAILGFGSMVFIKRSKSWFVK